ncbi:ABC transporter permease [Mesorhizobium sp. CCNWLW179-1]|uniref:ABC transporter permease n=1 Tax=unclassified Mesorhizobium TaxID=325217 RepID=UPI0030149E5B
MTHSNKWRPLIYVWTALVLFFLMLPLLVVIPISFSSASYLQFPPPQWSLRWYQAFFNDPVWIDAAIRSTKIAIAATTLATIVGTMLAFSLVRGNFTGRAAISQFASTPIIVPTIIYAVAINGAFAKLRLIGEWYGIALAHAVLAIPYVVLIVSAALRTVDPALEQAAAGLGASQLTAIRRITLPLIRPAMISGMFLAFISSFDELVVAMFLGGANVTLPKKMFDNIVNAIDPTIAAVSVLEVALWSGPHFTGEAAVGFRH